MSFYKHHVFFCLNKRDPPEACCANHGSEAMRDAVGSGWDLAGYAKAAERPFSGFALGRALPPHRHVHVAPADLDRYVRGEAARWQKLISSSNIKPE